MQRSWSHNLFLWIHRRIGRHAWLDQCMVFCAVWLIFLYGFCVLYLAVPLILFSEGDYAFFSFLSLGITTICFAIMANWIFAWLFPRPRPVVEFAQVTPLVKPMSNWKAFPSDHTTIAFVIALFSTLFLSGFPVFAFVSFLVACLIAFARIYVGVHYPRDILGGVVSAFFFFELVVYSMKPMILSFFMYINSLFGIV